MKAIGYSSLTLAMLASFGTAHAAGLDRSGQDITAFLQDGTYAEVTYTYLKADITGKDTAGNVVGNISKPYDFFRYGVKADVNDTISVGVLYDEPFGALVEYQGDNDFTGSANKVAAGVIAVASSQARQDEIAEKVQTLKDSLAKTKADQKKVKSMTPEWRQYQQDIQAYQAMVGLLNGVQRNLKKVADAQAAGATPELISEGIKADLANSKTNDIARWAIGVTTKALADKTLSPSTHQEIAQRFKEFADSGETLKKAPEILDLLTADNGNTNVSVKANSLTGLVGAKFGGMQVYGGPAFQRLEGDIHLRGNAYQRATNYNATISPSHALGWVAGLAYSKPEIALKASLTYRSKIDHKADINEVLPLAVMRQIPTDQSNTLKVQTPESFNLDFQTGLSAKHRLLGTAKVRYVPWSKFKVAPPLYSGLAQTNLVSYDKDQWSAEVGLGKQVNDKLAVQGSVGWDSGAGNPTTSLGPVNGYYSVGLGTKYSITPNWALSAGAKYLKFGNATAQLPTKVEVGDFRDNDGYAVGVKLSYQGK